MKSKKSSTEPLGQSQPNLGIQVCSNEEPFNSYKVDDGFSPSLNLCYDIIMCELFSQVSDVARGPLVIAPVLVLLVFRRLQNGAGEQRRTTTYGTTNFTRFVHIDIPCSKKKQKKTNLPNKQK